MREQESQRLGIRRQPMTHGRRVARLLFPCVLFAAWTVASAQVSPRLSSEADIQSTERLPVPDPTRLTSQALREAIAALKAVIDTRMDAMEKTIELNAKRAERFAPEFDAKIKATFDLLSERFTGIGLQFEGIQLQFKERDTRVEQTARDSKTAVDAALQAAKEAVEKQNAASSQAAQKSEGAFTKQIDQLAELFRNGTKSLEDKITIANKVNDDKQSAINDRITRIEAIALGARTAKTDGQDNTLVIIAIIGGLVGVAGLFMVIVGAIRHKP
jgi:hypothetical protein